MLPARVAGNPWCRTVGLARPAEEHPPASMLLSSSSIMGGGTGVPDAEVNDIREDAKTPVLEVSSWDCRA